MRMLLLLLLPLLSACWRQDPGLAAFEIAEQPLALVARPSKAPATEIVLMIRAGSAHDPSGQEGLAWLTARLLREGGAGGRSPEEVDELLYRLGTDVQVDVDKEIVSFRTRALHEDLPEITDLLADMVLEPGLDPKVLDRLKAEAVEDLQTGILGSDEALGQEVFEAFLFEGHPYGHPVQGRTGTIPGIDVDDVQRFLDERFIRPAAVLGLAGPAVTPEGGISAEAPGGPALRELHQRLSDLPARLYRDVTPRGTEQIDGLELLVVEKPGAGAGIHFGHPTGLHRAHPDWPAMLVAITALGEHRQSHGRLYRALRSERGLNYGDYAYIEVYRQDGWSARQMTGTGRAQSPFYVWIRPVSAENGPFALKAALSLVEDWARDGLSLPELDLMKKYLSARIALWADEPARRLGWAVEARLMGWPDPIESLPARIDALSLEEVNAAIRRHIHPENLRIVAVTGDAEAFTQALDASSPIRYGAEPPAADSAQAGQDASWSARVLPLAEPRVLGTEDLFR